MYISVHLTRCKWMDGIVDKREQRNPSRIFFLFSLMTGPTHDISSCCGGPKMIMETKELGSFLIEGWVTQTQTDDVSMKP